MEKNNWAKGDTVARVKEGQVTIEKIERVTPSGQAKLAGRAERYFPEGDLVGSRGRGISWDLPRIKRPTPEDIEAARLSEERDRLWAEIRDLYNFLPKRLSSGGVDTISRATSALKAAMVTGGAK